MAEKPAEDEDPAAAARAVPPASSGGRDLTRRRARRVPSPQTGRVHHLGLPPAAQPVHTAAGVDWTRAADVRLRALTASQLVELGSRLRWEMREASDRLDYERAAELLAEVRAVERFTAG